MSRRRGAIGACIAASGQQQACAGAWPACAASKEQCQRIALADIGGRDAITAIGCVWPMVPEETKLNGLPRIRDGRGLRPKKLLLVPRKTAPLMISVKILILSGTMVTGRTC
ncbi:hypothetical protein HPP92_006859 [Vanilla planifolia]|uniref:Uncharacterized protein n=1 Tax=Vanilla planifolia TaxID=51239 RepID=A0A835RCY0_VANPL|nr:hypothetical protein HPP92_007094 [Vanilla planifolia]KAG0489996.1 hypothetical protein HPP92_006859 [Vanilla planifolia]